MGSITLLKEIMTKISTSTKELLSTNVPNPMWNNIQGGWRHHPINYANPLLYMFTKIGGSISTSNAMLLLIENGFMFQAAILARSILESNLNVTAILPNKLSSFTTWPTEKQNKYLENYFRETWKNPTHPFENDKQRSQPNLKELAAALGNFQDKTNTITQHDACQVTKQMMMILSDYTHMAYPRVMELWEGHQGFKIDGNQQKHFTFGVNNAAGIIHNCCIMIDCIIEVTNLVGCKFIQQENINKDMRNRIKSKLQANKKIQQQTTMYLKDIENNFEVLSPNDKQLLQNFKNK